MDYSMISIRCYYLVSKNIDKLGIVENEAYDYAPVSIKVWPDCKVSYQGVHMLVAKVCLPW